MNERGYTPTEEDLEPIPLPPPEGWVTDTADRPQPPEQREPRYGATAQELLMMMEADQAPRREHRWDEAAEVDEDNAAQLRKIISTIGWPNASRVGAEAAHAAWLIVQHADSDPAWQAECLDMMRQEPEHEVSPEDIAYLEDRVLVSQGKPQRFGTQLFAAPDGRIEPNEIEDPERIDERRAAVGMESLTVYRAGVEQYMKEHPQQLTIDTGTLTEERAYELAMEQTPPVLRPIFSIMRELGRSKWVHAAILGATITAQGMLKFPEYRNLTETERVVAEQRAELSQRELQVGSRLERLDALLGDKNPFYIELQQDIVANNELWVRDQRKSFNWFSSPRELEQPQSVPDYLHQDQEPARAIVTSDLRSRDPVYKREMRIPADSLVTMLQQDFPKGWVDTEVDSVTQTDEEIKMPEVYGIAGIEAAHCQTDGNGRSSIVLSGGARTESALWTTLELLPHELAHANDWASDAEMTFNERVILLDEIVQRVTSPDRWKSSYVEDIKNKDLQLQLSRRAGEYWAEICATYFHTPTKLNKKDFDIVDRVVRAHDPKFELRKSINHRADVVWAVSDSYPKRK